MMCSAFALLASSPRKAIKGFTQVRMEFRHIIGIAGCKSCSTDLRDEALAGSLSFRPCPANILAAPENVITKSRASVTSEGTLRISRRLPRTWFAE